MSITNFNATTPQLKAVKKLMEAYLSLNINNIEPYILKDFKFQMFPRVTNLPDEAKGTHFKRYGPAFALMTKAEVVEQAQSIFYTRHSMSGLSLLTHWRY